MDKNLFYKGKSYNKPYYQWIKENIDNTKLIQLGISISSEDGS